MGTDSGGTFCRADGLRSDSARTWDGPAIHVSQAELTAISTTASFLRLAVPVDFREFVAILFRYWRCLAAVMDLIDLFLVLLDQMLVRRVELAIGCWHCPASVEM